jgi:hypothetical protein
MKCPKDIKKSTCESEIDLCTTFQPTVRAHVDKNEKERNTIYTHIHMHSRRTTEKMDERTNGSTTNSPSFSSCYMCSDTLIAREGERVIDTESLHGSIQRTNSFSLFFLTLCSTTASRRFCSSSTELRVLIFFLHYCSRHHQHQVSQHTYT